MINPDESDLHKTQHLSRQLALFDRISWHSHIIGDYTHAGSPPDLITTISVIEHIPNDGDIDAVAKLWTMLGDDGVLILSVPVARTGYLEFIDFNEYELLDSDANGFCFGQRYYSWDDLRQRIFPITGNPTSWELIGEKEAFWFERDRARKNGDPYFPLSGEPFRFAMQFRRFDNLEQLPGMGVIAMVFKKKCA